MNIFKSCARVTARARSLQLDRIEARALARKKPKILGLGCSLAQNQIFPNYFELENQKF